MRGAWNTVPLNACPYLESLSTNPKKLLRVGPQAGTRSVLEVYLSVLIMALAKAKKEVSHDQESGSFE